MNSFRKWVERNYHVSRAMRKADVYGWVKVNFTVDTTGMLTDLSIVEDLGHGTGEELMRVLDLSNRKRGPWRPGIKDGKKVRVVYTFPVFVDAR